MKSADVVIIGAGVMGASVAYHLAARGCRNILVVERGSEPGQGSTSKATGGFRAQFGTEINIRLSLLSREKLLHFEEEFGIDPGYRTCGYLFLAESEAQMKALRAAHLIQKDAGLNEAEIVDRVQLRQLNPAVSGNDLIGGAFCSTDGFIHPMQILRGYCEGAMRLGVQFLFDAAVTRLSMNQDRISLVHTSKGDIAAGCVVNAAGAWAGLIAPVPVQPLRRQVAVTEPCDLLPEEMPMTIFVEDGFHFRVRDGRILLLWPDQPVLSVPFDMRVTNEWLTEVFTRAKKCIPCLKDVLIDRQSCWAGLYEMSPDKHALLGKAPQIENLYLINGSSGHGVMHAPVLGQLLAEIILRMPTSLDVGPLRPSRFLEGKPNPATEFF